MRRKQFSEEQIIGILKEAEAGAVVTELCRRHGMSSATYYAWKAKFGGLEVSDAKRLRALEEENARLKRLLADTMADFRCSAESLLAAAEGAVKSEKNKHGGEPTARVVIYLPVNEAARLTRRAKAAGVSRSAFVADLIDGYQHDE